MPSPLSQHLDAVGFSLVLHPRGSKPAQGFVFCFVSAVTFSREYAVPSAPQQHAVQPGNHPDALFQGLTTIVAFPSFDLNTPLLIRK